MGGNRSAVGARAMGLTVPGPLEGGPELVQQVRQLFFLMTGSIVPLHLEGSHRSKTTCQHTQGR